MEKEYNLLIKAKRDESSNDIILEFICGGKKVTARCGVEGEITRDIMDKIISQYGEIAIKCLAAGLLIPTELAWLDGQLLIRADQIPVQFEVAKLLESLNADWFDDHGSNQR